MSTENEVDSSGFDTEHFKSITSGDLIRVEPKYKSGFSFHPICKLVMALNNLPHSKDLSYGFLRRMLIIPFNRRFTPEEADPFLYEKLLMELPGILNFALAGLKRLRQNQFRFTSSSAINELLSEYYKGQNPIVEFFEDKIVVDSESRVSRKDILTSFRQWCRAKNHLRLAVTSEQKFWTQFRGVLEEKKSRFRNLRFLSISFRGLDLKACETIPTILIHITLIYKECWNNETRQTTTNL